MAAPSSRRRAAHKPVVADLDVELQKLGAKNVEALRESWREKHGAEPLDALSKDLIARALAHQLQEERLGGLDPCLRKLLGTYSGASRTPVRHVKVGSVIVREHQGMIHEVMVVPGGFCWQGQVFGSLSTIARKITGTSWNGPRFFGLRGTGEIRAQEAAAPAKIPSAVSLVGPDPPTGRARQDRIRGACHRSLPGSNKKQRR